MRGPGDSLAAPVLAPAAPQVPGHTLPTLPSKSHVAAGTKSCRAAGRGQTVALRTELEVHPPGGTHALFPSVSQVGGRAMAPGSPHRYRLGNSHVRGPGAGLLARPVIGAKILSRVPSMGPLRPTAGSGSRDSPRINGRPRGVGCDDRSGLGFDADCAPGALLGAECCAPQGAAEDLDTCVGPSATSPGSGCAQPTGPLAFPGGSAVPWPAGARSVHAPVTLWSAPLLGFSM